MYPLHLENENEKLYVRVFSDFSKRLIRELAPHLKKAFPEAVTDGAAAMRADDANDDIFHFIESLRGEFGDWIDSEVLESRIARNFNLLDAWSRDKTRESLNGLVTRLNTPLPPSVTGRPTPQGQSGELWLTTVNLNSGMTATMLDRTIRQNLGLIRSLASEHFDQVAGIIGNGYTGGQSLKTITDAIEDATGVNRNQAKFWARDQASKFFGAVTRERQTAAGIPGYIWRALKDGRVRDAHHDVAGKYFDWKNPPLAGVRGNPVHPGDDFNCRCWAEPAFGPEQEDQPVEREDPLAYMNRDYVPLREAVAQHEKVNRNLREMEMLQAFDARGRIMAQLRGGPSEIAISPREVRKLKDTVLTHNHPTGWRYSPSDPRYGGNSFSFEDIRTACISNVMEMRVTTPRYRFILRRPGSGWNQKYFDTVVKPCYLKHESAVSIGFIDKIGAGTITYQQAEANILHEIWTKVSRELGLEYFREDFL